MPKETGMKFTETPRTLTAVRAGENVSFHWEWMLNDYSISDLEEVIFLKGINNDRNKLLTIHKTGDKRWNTPRNLSCNTPPQTRVKGTWNRSTSALFTLYNVQHCDSGLYVLELDLGLLAGMRRNCVKLLVTGTWCHLSVCVLSKQLLASLEGWDEDVSEMCQANYLLSAI